MQATLKRLQESRKESGESGFTLIELLIVIVILGILASIVVFAVQDLTGSSTKAACGSDYKTIETALEAYKAQNYAYPANLSDLYPTYVKDVPNTTPGSGNYYFTYALTSGATAAADGGYTLVGDSNGATGAAALCSS